MTGKCASASHRMKNGAKILEQEHKLRQKAREYRTKPLEEHEQIKRRITITPNKLSRAIEASVPRNR